MAVLAAGLFLPAARLARCGGAGGTVLVLPLLAAASDGPPGREGGQPAWYTAAPRSTGVEKEDFLVETQKMLVSRISDVCAVNATAAKGTALRPASPDLADCAKTTYPLPFQTTD